MLKTLIVEDDFTCRLVLQEFLKNYGSAHMAVNGNEAVDAVHMALEARSPYDLICLDIMMPEMDGQQALKEIRKLEEAQGIAYERGAKIIITTALGDMGNVMQAYKGLCNGYLKKPINKADLVKMLTEFDLIPK